MRQSRQIMQSAKAFVAFEVAARHMSFTKAAAELDVTQAAVSRMIGRLESNLGTKLFARDHNTLRLTDDGAQLYAVVAPGLDELAAAVEQVSAPSPRDDSVTLSVTSAFATHWILPRLPRFHEACPDIDLRFKVLSGEASGPVETVDLAVRFDMSDQARLHRWPLMREQVLAVCSPGYLAAHGPLDAGSDLSGHTLVHQSGVKRVPWDRFLSHFRLPAAGTSRSLAFSDYSVALHGAITGEGIALGWRHVAADELLKGNLVLAYERGFETGNHYYLVATKSRAMRRAAARVRRWLLSEMAQIDRGLALLFPQL